MREIKFRAFWKDTLKPVKYFNTEYTIDACNDNSFIVNQFTGFKDKNGKEIYERDIISRLRGVSQISWDSDGWYVKTFAGWKTQTEVYAYQKISELSDIEVIGNIYENPELLSGS